MKNPHKFNKIRYNKIVKYKIKIHQRGANQNEIWNKFSRERLITPIELGIVGLLLDKTDFKKKVDAVKLKDNENPQIKNSDVAVSYIGLLCQGKSDFDDVREMLEDLEFFTYALNIKKMPSSETLRQRLNMAGKKLREIILEENIKMLKEAKVDLTPCIKEWIPLGIDVSPFDNSNTKKEGISYTYKGFEGYSPIFAYLGKLERLPSGYFDTNELILELAMLAYNILRIMG